MTTVAKELIDICEAVEPASKFGEKNKYTKDGVIMSFELGSDESILNLKFEGEGDTRVALDKTFTDQKVSVADMQRIISEHGLAICESSDYCFEVELSDEDFDNGFTALSKKFDVEMPLAEGVYRILYGGESPELIMRELFARPLKAEQLF